MKNIFITLSFLFLFFSSGKAASREVKSPDGHIKISFGVNAKGEMSYRIWVNDKDFILPSALGFEERTGKNLSSGFKIVSEKISQRDECWTQPWGENKRLRNYYNELLVTLKNAQNTEVVMTFRLFDDGLGFCYDYKVPEADSLLLTAELTTFNISQGGTSWSIPTSFDTYELEYRTLPLDKVETANTPITFKSQDVYASIHEAALTDFPEMTLKNIGGPHFRTELAPWPDGVKARFEGGTFKTPWRTLQISPDAVGLINSSLILNLNEPCALATTDWIRPMKYVGIWWGMHLGVESWVINDRHGATTANAKRYIDFAARNNIDAVMIEGWNEGWESWGGRQHFNYTRPYADFDMDEITSYARKRGVEIIGHHETGGNIFNYEEQLDSAYLWYANFGVHSVKTGYAGGIPRGHCHHGQFVVNHYRRVVTTAAKYHTTLDVHEPVKDTGIRRTYPNMMTREGARGMEWNAWSDGNSPAHHELLPFTRLLAGPMDYTPGIFDILYKRAKNNPNRKKWNMKDSKYCRCNTTLAKQIANWVVIYSPLQMAADMIENYEGHPAFQFFRDFNADCDWSRALCGEPGEYVAIVRRAGEKYFLGATTNELAREFSLSLDFLEKGRIYKAVIYADAPEADWETNPEAFQITEKRVTSENSLTISMARGGGQAITFFPL